MPLLVVALIGLAALPVGQWLVELIVRPVTVSELVDRRVGLSTRLVAVDGYALLVPFAADPGAGATTGAAAPHWYAVRDSLQERRLVLVRSTVLPDALRTRTVEARIVDDPLAVSGTVDGIVARGGSATGDTLAPWLLDEVEPGARVSATDIGSLAELDQRAVGDVVRLRLTVTEGIASCLPRGDCRARRLADGIGSWDYLAADSAGGRVVLRTGYPPSVAPFHGVGHHAQDRDAVAGLLATPFADGLLGWGRVLEAAYVEHDLRLPIDRLWLGPILFSAVAAVVLLGLWLGYPRFRSRGPGGLASERAERSQRVLRCRATGRLTPPGLSPFEVSDTAATLSAEPDGGSLLAFGAGATRREVAIPRGLGSLGAVEVGDWVRVRGGLPALQVGWFGSQVLLVFDDAPTRDRAAAVVLGG